MRGDSSEEGELPQNPADRSVVVAAPTDKTAMIDLEAVEAKRAAKRAAEAAQAAERDPPDTEEDGDGERTSARDGELSRDGDATGSFARKSKAKRLPTRIVRDEMSARDNDVEQSSSQLAASEVRVRTGLKLAPVAATPVRAEARAARRPVFTPVAVASLAIIVLCGLIGALIVAVRASGVLTVTTVPIGAEVHIDGVVVGLAPLQKRVQTGTHTIELALEGYEPFREVVDVPSAGLGFMQPLKALPPPPPPPPTNEAVCADLGLQAKRQMDRGELDAAADKLAQCERLIAGFAGNAAITAVVQQALAQREAERRRLGGIAAAQAQATKARTLLEDGRRAYESGKLGQAREKLYESLKLDSGSADAHRILAKVFNREGDVDKTRYHLERYLALGGADGDFKVRDYIRTHKPK